MIDAFFTYKTPNGNVPIISMDKDKLEKFIQDMENQTNSIFHFNSAPLNHQSSENFQNETWVYFDQKFYFVDYDDGHSAFDTYCMTVTQDLINKIKIIYNSIS